MTDNTSNAHVTSSSDFRSNRNFSSNANSETVNTTLTANLSVSVNLGPVSLGGPSISHSKSWSRTSAQGNENSWGYNQSNTSSDESRRSASFELGLRLVNTPFPDMPAGSLLLVQLPRGETAINKIKDIQIIRTNSSFLVQAASDYYLVANDCTSNDHDALSVHVLQQRPLSIIARDLSQTMIRSLETIATEGARFIHAGAISPTDMQNLRHQTINNLQIHGEDIHQAALLHDFYESWINSELS